MNSEGSRVIAVSFTPQTKTTLDGFQPKFVDNDSILISNGVAIDTCDVKVEGNAATISTNLTGPLTAVYPYRAAKMDENDEYRIDTVLVSTEQSGAFADANICMAKMENENDESLSFVNKTAVFCIKPAAGASSEYVEVKAEGFNIANNIPAESAFTDYSTIRVAPVTTDSVYVSILVPDGLKIGKLTFSDGTKEKAITTGAQATEEIAAGTLYTVDNEGWRADGALKGVFTVNAQGKKVHFSQGNLQATYNSSASTYTWGFAANQYDYIGNAAGNTTISSQTNGAVVDLFGLSTASTTYGISTSTSSSSYSGDFVDWGKAYCANNSITPDNTWRTLTTAEWQYLFNSRTNASSLYKYGVTVCDKTNCLIIAPDNWDTSANHLQASYDATAWATAEAAGLVCLPAAGYRSGSNVKNVGGYGYYWSSTASGSDRAYCVDFYSYAVDPAYLGYRRSGCSVRLVTDVSPAPAPTPTPADVDYIEIKAKYNGTDSTILKWSKQNLAITTSGNKSWKGGNTETAVKVPGTNEDVKVGDYFQWAVSYEGYNVTENKKPDTLLLYSAFTNKHCVDGGTEDKFTFKSDKQFDEANAPYYSGSAYTTYTSSSDPTLASSDDVANIILGDNWRMPTSDEFNAMKSATYWAWDTNDCGYYVFMSGLGTSGAPGAIGNYNSETDNKSAALLFFPAAGFGDGTFLYSAGSCGNYWSSSLYTSNPSNAYYLCLLGGYVYPQYYNYRYYCFSVRPVSE